MNNAQNVTLGILLVTAALMAGLLVGIGATHPAYADTSIRGGQYVIVSGAVSDDVDYAYVIDLAASRLNFYGYSPKTRQIEMGAAPVDLKKLFSE